MYQLSKRSLERLKGVNPELVKIFKEAIKNSPYDFGIPKLGGKRDAEQQNELYLQKKSKCDGFKKLSYHQSGNAIDIYAYVDGKASWKRVHLVAIGEHILQVAKECFGVDLRWGADWDQDGVMVWDDKDESFVDLPHFEMR